MINLIMYHKHIISIIKLYIYMYNIYIHIHTNSASERIHTDVHSTMPNPWVAESLNSELRFRSPPPWEEVIHLANQTLPIFSLRIPTIWTLKQGLGLGSNHWKTSFSIHIRVVRNIKQQPMSSNSQLFERSERKGPQAAFPLAAVRLVPESNFCCCIWTHHSKHQLIHQNHSTSTLLLHPSILQTFLRNKIFTGVPQLRHESKKTQPLRNSTCFLGIPRHVVLAMRCAKRPKRIIAQISDASSEHGQCSDWRMPHGPHGVVSET